MIFDKKKKTIKNLKEAELFLIKTGLSAIVFHSEQYTEYAVNEAKRLLDELQ